MKSDANNTGATVLQRCKSWMFKDACPTHTGH